MSGFEDLLHLIERVTGNVSVERDSAGLKRVVDARLRATESASCEAYFRLLRDDPASPEWRHLVSHITVKESYLFRGRQQFEALSNHVLPHLARAEATEGGPIKVWSAGCARGEEAATLAIVLAESQHLTGRHWQILGTDVDEVALEVAARGRFGKRAVSHVPAPLLGRYFTREDGEHELASSLRRRIEYRYMNLIHDRLPVEDDSFHIIFLRNVLIYFRQSSQKRVLAEMARALAKCGWLFLGPTEAMWAISKVLTPEELSGCFAYRHPSSAPEPGRTANHQSGNPPPARPPVDSSVVNREPAAVVQPAAPTRSGEDERPALHPSDIESLAWSLRKGRSAEVEDRLRELAKDGPEGPDLYLLLGIACDLRGDMQSAVEAYRGAVYLEAEHFHARFLLAESLRRLGWGERAAGEYKRVVALLTAGRGVPSAYAWALALPDRLQVLARSEALLQPGAS